MQFNDFVADENRRLLESYKIRPAYVREHAGRERNVLGGAYSFRQVSELIQNAADAILEGESPSDESRRILLLSTSSHLYAANTGAPFTPSGVEAILNADISPKEGNQIGRFGIGFKSLLRFDREVLVLSQTVGFRFDPPKCRQAIRDYLHLSADHDAPGMRLAWPADSEEARGADLHLHEMLGWATTVVRAEIADAKDSSHVERDLKEFRKEFLLFISSDVQLDLQYGSELRRLRREPEGDNSVLWESDESSRWRIFERTVTVTDPDARRDATHLHDRHTIPITWAVPLDAKDKGAAGQFWAFLPTQTPNRISGILSAPWKVGADRQGLTPGEFNQLLLRHAAELVSNSLPQLWQADDPAVVLDYFPRQLESREEIAGTLVEALWKALLTAAIVPDGTGVLRPLKQLNLHPIEDHELIAKWHQLADESLLKTYPHLGCTRRDRLPRLRELSERLRNATQWSWPGHRSELNGWLSNLRPIGLEKIRALLELAADLKRRHPDKTGVVLSATFIPDANGQYGPGNKFVIGAATEHFFQLPEEIWNDGDCRKILRELGVEEWNQERWRKQLQSSLDVAIRKCAEAAGWNEFWRLMAAAPPEVATDFAEKHCGQISAICLDGKARVPAEALLAGSVALPSDAAARHWTVAEDADGLGLHQLLVDAGFSKEPPRGWQKMDLPLQKIDRLRPRRGFTAEIERYEKTTEPNRRRDYYENLVFDQIILPSCWLLLRTATERSLSAANLTRFFVLGAASQKISEAAVTHSGGRRYRQPEPHPATKCAFLDRYLSVGSELIPL